MASTPAGATKSVGVQLVANAGRTTTMRRSPLPLVQLTVIWFVCTAVNSSVVACTVGSAATIVCAPPAVVLPDLVAAVKPTSPVVIAATLIVLP